MTMLFDTREMVMELRHGCPCMKIIWKLFNKMQIL
ncbi:hypothetical protein Patl1_26399 [Pistacia atlantica]|uniref:Uncharacterized protein n=1 Tax=Pistacia atlantica TaxID=434234 RepID=A0ACC1B3Q1_9ROSI|nr:hypothetical protein Patl1_26399 [Pistacia atlantica]